MKIVKITLHLYKRLRLKRINTFVYTPESKVQMILGTNGSGKSSIIKELTPLPAIPGEYDKGGFKIIEIIHKNSYYILKSLIGTNGNKFHFIKDGVDLMGEGGTSPVYKDWVLKEFGISAEIHEFLTGVTSFSKMEVAKRRNWITRLSDADYTYAFKYFQKLSTQHRDLIGGIKLQQARLVQETDKLISPEKETILRKEIGVLNETLISFLEQKTPRFESMSDLMKSIVTVDDVISTTFKQVISLRKMVLSSGEKFTSVDDINNRIISTKADIQTYQREMEIVGETIISQQQTIEKLRSTNVQSIGDIEEHLETIFKSINDEASRLYFKDFSFKDPSNILTTLLSLYESLVEVFQNIETNHDRHYTRDDYFKELENLRNLNARTIDLKAKRDEFVLKKKELEHLKTHDQITCPKCEYKWYHGFDESTYRKVSQELENCGVMISVQEKAIIEKEEYLQRAKTYLETFKSFLNVKAACPQLDQFWDYLIDSNVIFETPRQVVTLMEHLKEDLSCHVRIKALEVKQKENMDLKIMLSRDQQLNLSKLNEDANKAEVKLYELSVKLRTSKERASRLDDLKSTIETMQTLTDKINTFVPQRNERSVRIFEYVRRDALNEFINITQKEISYREQLISKIDIQKALVADIQTQITEMSETADVLKIAVDELSPTKGLIAKGLTGFINHYTAQVNGFVKKVWLYPMEIVAITPTDDDCLDLDYRFEVRVNENDSHVIADISRVSSGMAEIIDLGFRIVSMSYLGLQEFPIYLDEFAKSMDPEHRRSAFHFITSLLTSANFSQIFMVSHYQESYGSLANTDIMVLCNGDFELGKGTVFNKHVTFN